MPCGCSRTATGRWHKLPKPSAMVRKQPSPPPSSATPTSRRERIAARWNRGVIRRFARPAAVLKDFRGRARIPSLLVDTDRRAFALGGETSQEQSTVTLAKPPGPGQFLILGDALVGLYETFNPVWTWSTFDNPSPDRHPYEFNEKNNYDWTHSGCIQIATDGNLVVSSHNQNWVMKIRYDGGAGDGAILWKLGYQGDFRRSSQLFRVRIRRSNASASLKSSRLRRLLS